MSYYTAEERWKYLLECAKVLNRKDSVGWPDIIIKSSVHKTIFSKYCKVHDVTLDNNYLNISVNEILSLDYNIPRKDSLGCDGFSLYMNIPKYDIYFSSWCYCSDKYFYRIIELANYLLKCTSVYSNDLFVMEEDLEDVTIYNPMVIDNEILLDRKRLLRQFDSKFCNKDCYSTTLKNELRSRVAKLSCKKIHKINYNLGNGMMDDLDRTLRIIDYVEKQKEDENYDPFSWCSYEEEYVNIYGEVHD